MPRTTIDPYFIYRETSDPHGLTHQVLLGDSTDVDPTVDQVYWNSHTCGLTKSALICGPDPAMASTIVTGIATALRAQHHTRLWCVTGSIPPSATLTHVSHAVADKDHDASRVLNDAINVITGRLCARNSQHPWPRRDPFTDTFAPGQPGKHVNPSRAVPALVVILHGAEPILADRNARNAVTRIVADGPRWGVAVITVVDDIQLPTLNDPDITRHLLADPAILLGPADRYLHTGLHLQPNADADGYLTQAGDGLGFRLNRIPA